MSKNLDRAMTAASEYRRLARDGRWAEAQQIEASIDVIVGRWTPELDFVWPRSVASAAGVPHVRRRLRER